VHNIDMQHVDSVSTGTTKKTSTTIAFIGAVDDICRASAVPQAQVAILTTIPPHNRASSQQIVRVTGNSQSRSIISEPWNSYPRPGAL